MEEEKKQEEALPKKSEIIKEQKELVEQYNKVNEDLLNKEYTIKVDNRAQFKKLCDFVDHKLKATYNNAPDVLMLQSNLKQQKPFAKSDDWNGHIKINQSSAKALWSGIKDWEGNGAFETVEFLTIVRQIGPDVVNAINDIRDVQKIMRGYLERLSTLDDIIDSKKYEDDMPDEEIEKVKEKEDERIEEMKEEVSPSAE